MAAGYTQQEVADKIGKGRPLISHIEQTGKVNEKTLAAICKVLVMTTDDLKDMVNEPSKKYKRLAENDLHLELERQRNEIENLKDLVSSQKRVIEMLEERVKRKK